MNHAMRMDMEVNLIIVIVPARQKNKLFIKQNQLFKVLQNNKLR